MVSELNNNLNVQNAINLNNCTTLEEIVSLLRNNSLKYGTGNIGNLDSSSLKTLLGNPTGFGNYTQVTVRYHSYSVLTVVAIALAGTSKKFAKAYIWSNNNDYFKTDWNVIV